MVFSVDSPGVLAPDQVIVQDAAAANLTDTLQDISIPATAAATLAAVLCGGNVTQSDCAALQPGALGPTWSQNAQALLQVGLRFRLHLSSPRRSSCASKDKATSSGGT